MSVFAYLFDPTPPVQEYGSIQMMPSLFLVVALLIASFALSRWRKNATNVVTKKLAKTWPKAAFIFGFTGLILVVSRAEGIQYISMRFWWVLWAAFGLLFAYLQHRVFKARHYEVMKSDTIVDPREKYLPKKK